MTEPRRWYFDVVSPFAYLHWQKVRPLVAAFDITPVPIVFGAVLAALGQRGPAEIVGKREFTYRHVLWQARRDGIALRFPDAHPFNPLTALRLCVAAGATPDVVSTIFDWIWAQGRRADSTEALAPLLMELGIAADTLSSDAVKATLRANTDAALAANVFGVPTLAIGDALFWGSDAHDFAEAVLRDPALLADPEMQRVSTLPMGIRRQ